MFKLPLVSYRLTMYNNYCKEKLNNNIIMINHIFIVVYTCTRLKLLTKMIKTERFQLMSSSILLLINSFSTDEHLIFSFTGGQQDEGQERTTNFCHSSLCMAPSTSYFGQSTFSVPCETFFQSSHLIGLFLLTSLHVFLEAYLLA